MSQISFRTQMAASLFSIAVGATALGLEWRALARLSAHPASLPPVAARAAGLPVAEARVHELERQLAAARKNREDSPSRAQQAAAIRKLQARVEGERTREAIHAAYGPLILKLGLDTAASARLETILGQEHLAAKDALAAAKALGYQSMQDYRSAVEEAVSQDDQQIQALLGADGYAQFDAYRQTLPEQETVAQLAERLSATAAPLSEGQQAQLIPLLEQLQPSAYRENETFLAALGLNESPLTSAIISAAAGILSAPQEASLRQLQDDQTAVLRLGQSLLQKRE